MPLSRAACSTAAIGFTALASCETSLPSVSPKPPGSMKSRCMSMMTRAVVDQSRSIGSGSAITVPRLVYFEFAMMPALPERENSREQLSKAYAIVYNSDFAFRENGIRHVFKLLGDGAAFCSFAVRSFCDVHLLIR